VTGGEDESDSNRFNRERCVGDEEHPERDGAFIVLRRTRPRAGVAAYSNSTSPGQDVFRIGGALH